MAHSLRARPPPSPPPGPANAPDVEKERLADEHLGGEPLVVDRGILKNIVEREMAAHVERIEFLGSGTFHKCYLVTLKDKPPAVARIAQPYFPHNKTASEVATLAFLSRMTPVPVPTIFAHDPTSDNGLRAEYTIESLAPGVKLSSLAPASLPQPTLIALMRNLARILVPVTKHRFSKIGSLYFASSEECALGGREGGDSAAYAVGPIVSWPFFGNGRGFRALDRGPWASEREYLDACVRREIDDIRREGELSSGSASNSTSPEADSDNDEADSALDDDDSTEEEEEDDAYGPDGGGGSLGASYNPHELMYKAYRQQQSLLVTPFRRFSVSSPVKSRLELVEDEMARFMQQMEAFGVGQEDSEGFALDLHDVRADNIFVDPEDPTRIACIIDFESTALRPLSQASHLPALLLPPPAGLPSFTSSTTAPAPAAPNGKPPAPTQPTPPKPQPPSPFATPELQAAFRDEAAKIDSEWVRRERAGRPKRIAHRCVEWDGWEVGLVDHVLGGLR